MGLAIGIAELMAAFGEWIGVFSVSSSPLNSLGQTFIQFTPEWLKEFAIRTFGEHDKTTLTVGMGVTLVIVAGERIPVDGAVDSGAIDSRAVDSGAVDA